MKSMESTRDLRVRKALVANIVVFVAFLVTAQIGTHLYQQTSEAPIMIWAPIGISLAAVIIRGYSILPSIALASIVHGFTGGMPLFFIATSVVGNTLQPTLAYFLLKKANFNSRLVTVKDMFLMLGTAVFATIVSPALTMAAILFHNGEYGSSYEIFWMEWWVGGILSALVLVPLLIRWIGRPLPRPALMKKVEIVAAILVLCAVSTLLFATPYTTIGGLSVIYPLLAALLWIAFRAGSRTMALGIFLMTTISIIGALYGDYAPAPGGLSRRIFSIQVFDIFIATLFFVIVSIEEQRKRALVGMKLRAEELESAMERIRQDDQAKGDFIAMLAHELRNPLATFLSSTELLLIQNPPDTEQWRLADMMRGRVRTMARLLDNMLDISRINRRQIELKKERVDLQVLVRRAIATVDAPIKERRQSLTVSLPMEMIMIYADPFRMEQALVNLLSNASKYTPPEGRIELTGKYQDGWLSISIIDTGIGIPPDMLTRIFDPFVQIKPKGKGTEGLGIGLALAKNLIEMQGGTITAEPTGPGEGSEFLIRIPAEEISVPRPGEDEPEAGMNLMNESSSGLKILVVDDNIDAAAGIGKLLELHGHRITLAHDGQTALSRVKSEEPNVVLLDLGLPDMDGYEVVRKLKSQKSKLPVLIALTGYGQIEDIERTRQAGFDHHLTKPVGLADIEVLLEEIKDNTNE